MLFYNLYSHIGILFYYFKAIALIVLPTNIISYIMFTCMNDCMNLYNIINTLYIPITYYILTHIILS